MIETSARILPPAVRIRILCFHLGSVADRAWALTSSPRSRGMVVSNPANFSLVASYGVNTVRTYASYPWAGPAGYVAFMNQAAAAGLYVMMGLQLPALVSTTCSSPTAAACWCALRGSCADSQVCQTTPGSQTDPSSPQVRAGQLGGQPRQPRRICRDVQGLLKPALLDGAWASAAAKTRPAS